MGKCRMIDCTVCKKEIRSNNMTRHMRTHRTPYEKKITHDKKGVNFFMTFVNGWFKEELSERLAKIEEIKQYIICNETGASGEENKHSHAVVVLTEALSFENFKKFWEGTYLLPKYGDIESCKNIRQSFKYCSKEDHLCDFAAIDADYLHPHTTSYLASLRYDRLSITSYPYCRLVGPQRREFEERFNSWKEAEKLIKGKEENEDKELRPWQIAVLKLLRNQDDRKVLWIKDDIGNSGKSFLATYLMNDSESFVVEGGSTRDLSFAYKDQPNVVFDFCRSQKEFVNYHIIEAFKNGRMFSSKYQSTLRTFPSAHVVCFANFDLLIEFVY